jgi:hypothetical protein
MMPMLRVFSSAIFRGMSNELEPVPEQKKSPSGPVSELRFAREVSYVVEVSIAVS